MKLFRGCFSRRRRKRSLETMKNARQLEKQKKSQSFISGKFFSSLTSARVSLMTDGSQWRKERHMARYGGTEQSQLINVMQCLRRLNEFKHVWTLPLLPDLLIKLKTHKGVNIKMVCNYCDTWCVKDGVSIGGSLKQQF